jgi:hypothetical protein
MQAAIQPPELEPYPPPTPVIADPLPVWQDPSEPQPCGFARGITATVIFDVSGTLHPRLQGRFPEELAAVAAFLDPSTGEMLTQQAFDVIAFAEGAHSWALTRAQRMHAVLEGSKRVRGRLVRASQCCSLCEPHRAVLDGEVGEC